MFARVTRSLLHNRNDSRVSNIVKRQQQLHPKRNGSSSHSHSEHPHGHGHGQLSHPKEPYAPKHHDHYPEKPYLFGIKPGDKLEGWEIITWGSYFIAFVGCSVGLYSSDTDTFQDWARREAIARNVIIENEGTIEFGKYYQSKTYEFEDEDTAPKIADSE